RRLAVVGQRQVVTGDGAVAVLLGGEDLHVELDPVAGTMWRGEEQGRVVDRADLEAGDVWILCGDGGCKGGVDLGVSGRPNRPGRLPSRAGRRAGFRWQLWPDGPRFPFRAVRAGWSGARIPEAGHLWEEVAGDTELELARSSGG